MQPLFRLLTAPSILGDSFSQSVQSFQERLLLSGRLCRGLTPFFGGALLGLATFLSG